MTNSVTLCGRKTEVWAEPFMQTCRRPSIKEQWLETVDTQRQSPSTFLDMGPPSRRRTFPVQGAVFPGIQAAWSLGRSAAPRPSHQDSGPT